jgi:hypothetical protein
MMIRDLNTGRMVRIDQFQQDMGSKFNLHTFEQSGRAESFAQQEPEAVNEAEVKEKASMGWLAKLFRGSDAAEEEETTGKKGGNVVKIKANSKSQQEYSAARVIQHLLPHTGPVWTFKFSPDGCYLATAGQDSLVRVWCVVGSETSSEKTLLAAAAASAAASGLSSLSSSSSLSSLASHSGGAGAAPGSNSGTSTPTTPRLVTPPSGLGSARQSFNGLENATAGSDTERERASSNPAPSSNSSNSSTSGSAGGKEALSRDIPVAQGGRCIVHPIPLWTYAGHKSDVIDLAWSKARLAWFVCCFCCLLLLRVVYVCACWVCGCVHDCKCLFIRTLVCR